MGVRCGGCLVWWMSYFTHSVVDVWCGGCLVWWMSFFYLWCGGCLVWWMSGVVDVLFYTWCGGCPVWWMSGVVDVLFYPWCGGCLCGGCRTILVPYSENFITRPSSRNFHIFGQ